jgi:hypothetical protein
VLHSRARKQGSFVGRDDRFVDVEREAVAFKRRDYDFQNAECKFILLYGRRKTATIVLDGERSEGLPCGCKPPCGRIGSTTLTKIVDC